MLFSTPNNVPLFRFSMDSHRSSHNTGRLNYRFSSSSRNISNPLEHYTSSPTLPNDSNAIQVVKHSYTMPFPRVSQHS